MDAEDLARTPLNAPVMNEHQININGETSTTLEHQNSGSVEGSEQEGVRKPASRIAFGSCNDQDTRNDLWSIIEARDPAAFIWGGDAVYGGM